MVTFDFLADIVCGLVGGKVVRDGMGYDHNVLGAGKSQGEGYFLLKLANESVTMTDPAWYTIDADATVSDLKNLDDTGYASAAEAGDPDSHVEDFLTEFSSDDLPADQNAAESLDLAITDAPDTEEETDEK